MMVVLLSIIYILAYLDVKALDSKISTAIYEYNQNNFAILILGEAGVGQGGQWEEAPHLTDSIVLVQFVPKYNAVDLVSVPRDLYGTFGSSTFKINEALERNELPQLMKAMPDITGISVSKFAVIDLSSLKDIVDALGGVDVNLPVVVTDSVSGYSLTAGTHHLNGSTVDWLIRNRYAPQGDFFREENQHLIIEAMVKKFLNLNVIDQTKFMIAVSPEINKIDTNVNPGEIYPLISEGNNLTFHSAIFGFSTGLVESSSTPVATGSQYILIPTAGMNNYSQIRSYINLQLQPASPR